MLSGDSQYEHNIVHSWFTITLYQTYKIYKQRIVPSIANKNNL